MTDILDLVARLPKEPDPEPEHIAEPRELHDPSRPTRHWLRGARKGSGPWKARHLTWRVHLAMVHYQPHMLASDYAVLDAIMRMMNDLGTDRLTVSILEVEAKAGTKHQTTFDAMNRLMSDGWLIRVRRGVVAAPKEGGTGSGRAAEYRIAVPQSQPPSRKRRGVRESELDGRAKPSRDAANVCPATKVLTNHRVLQIPVSGRPNEASETVEISSGETVEIQPRETVEISPSDWLRERLARGPEMTRAVVAEGIEAGYARATIYRAAKALGVVSTGLHGFAEGYGKPPPHVTQWELP